MKLTEFLVFAKRATYANTSASSTRLEDGSIELTFSVDDFSYRDRYLGSRAFLGEELVFENGHAIWGMNYHGVSLTEEPSPAEIGTFLKSALNKVSEEYPYRGPFIHKFQDFEYHNQVDGTLESFSGHEEIYFQGHQVYYLHYHGGLIHK